MCVSIRRSNFLDDIYKICDCESNFLERLSEEMIYMIPAIE